MTLTVPKVGLVQLGCPKNLVDSERILTQLRAEGYVIAPGYDDADVVIVNIKSGATANSYVVTVGAVAASSCLLELRNTSGGPLSEAVVLSFAVLKAVAA